MPRRIARLVRGLPEIGVANQDPDTARRIRTINVIAAIACVLTAAYCAVYAVYDLPLFRDEVIFLLFVVPSYALILLVSRAQRVEAAMWLLIVVALMHLGIVSWMLGPRSGATAYLLATPFIATLLVRAGDRSTVWPVAGTASAILVVVSFWAPEGSFEALPPLAQRLLFFVNIAGAIVLASIISLFFRSLIERAEMKLRSEKARGDRLLRAILPDSIAERLKENPEQTVADRCSGATVLLADIVGFTQRSARLDPGRVVADLNRVFSHADEMAAARGVERIKTIGDGYLAVCGLPDPLPDPQARLAGFALDLRDHMSAFAQTFWPDLQFRTVIHAGPVVAGVIGRTKFAYDVWGDTVNTAARLEEVCEPGEILITEPVRAGLPERFIVGAPRRLNLRDKGEFTVFPLVGHR